MGNCKSCESRSTNTAKLILLDGQLQEFSWPIKVSNLLQENCDYFICSSDEMEFDEFVTEMGSDQELQPGELYFELPVGWRNHRLQAEDMALLAGKATEAISGNNNGDDDEKIVIGCCGCCCASRKIEPVTLFCEKERPLLAAEGGGDWAETGRRKGGCRRRKFVAHLSAIVEE